MIDRSNGEIATQAFDGGGELPKSVHHNNIKHLSMRTWIFCFGIMLLSVCKVQAQNDPVLAGMIYAYTDKAEKELKNQEKVMLMQTTGHIWLKEEVEGTTNLQREFNNYLDSFRSIVVYAAQVYGFYHEIDRLVDNLGGFTKQLDKHPSNAIAVALSAKRNKIYRELIMEV